MQEKFPKNPAFWFEKRTDVYNEAIDEIIKFYKYRIYIEEREFLKNVIAKFVDLVVKESNDREDSAIDKLNLIKFQFDDQKVTEWTAFYEEIRNPTNGSRKEWPTLPPVCDYQNFNVEDDTIETQSPSNATQTNQTEKEEVQKMFRDFKSKYDSWRKTLSQDVEKKLRFENTHMLRTWFVTRAWNAFRKAIQSNLIEKNLRDDFMAKNRIEQSGNKYLVVGSTMALALPAASRPSYLVSFEHS